MRRTQESDTGAVKNLDEIQEEDPGARPSRLGALILASLGGACIVLAAALLLRAPPRQKRESTDPLGDLVARTHPAGADPGGAGRTGGAAKAGDPVLSDITFPSVLSDTKNTTALEAVREGRPAGSGDAPFALPEGAPTLPPPAADRLPVVPLPAQNVLATPAGEAPSSDTLSAMAKHVSREDGGETAPAGAPGNYQLQVSSFKTQAEGDAFAAALRRRGHKAYVEPAYVKGRGLWYRVRIGPFKYRHSAVIYRQDFEAKERMVTFIVDPPKTTVRIRNENDDEP